MATRAARVLILVVLAGVATAIPVAVWGARGWAAGAAAAVAAGLVAARHVSVHYVEPVDALADVVRPHVDLPGAAAGDLARMAAVEYRDAVARAREAVSDGRRREAALRHTLEGLVLVDDAGLVEYANPAARTMLRERVLDASRRLASPELDALVERARASAAEAGDEVTLRTPAARQVLARAIPVGDDGVVLLLQDLAEAYRLDRVRRDFVANVSHELKTPVAGVRALADVASSAHADGDAASAGQFIGRLRREAERLGDLVDDLLDLSSVESGRELDMQEVDVVEVVQAAAERARTFADAKGVPVEVVGNPTTVEADATQLAMAVQNLVDNAVRYSERGTVRVGVRRRDDWVSIAVADEGIGIPDKDLPRIFERFYRVDRARSRATGGTGLGLSIVRHVAENHGGRVEVASQLGVGSTFTLWLPSCAGRPQGNAA